MPYAIVTLAILAIWGSLITVYWGRKTRQDIEQEKTSVTERNGE
jgi:hypothetical protein